MRPYLAMAWLFLCGLAVSLVCTAVMIVGGLGSDQSVAFLKAIGTVYSVPLGIMIAVVFGKRALLPDIGRGAAAFALAAVAFWALLPAALGLYGAMPFWSHNAVGNLAAHLELATVPVNGVISAVLTGLFPDRDRKSESAEAASPEADTMPAQPDAGTS